MSEHTAEKDATLSGTASAATTWNGGICGVCAARYLGSHTCSVEGLLERSDQLRRLAMEAFERLGPQPTTGPVLASSSGPECDHPGIEHGHFSCTMVCPGCGVCKFVGHGPLCTDCYEARVFPPAETRP